MTLRRLDIRGVRNLRETSLRDLRRANVFFGANGSGKTSLLEALHLLGMARSFRTAQIKSVITHGEEHCTVFGEIERHSGTVLTVGVSRDRQGSLDARVSGERISARSELAEAFPIQLIHAQSFEVLTGGPVERRHFMDWGVFHVEHQFLGVWQRFQRAIKQRNNLLRRGKISGESLRPWDREMAQAGEAIDRARSAYIRALEPHFHGILSRLTAELGEFELRYRRGWAQGQALEQALEESRDADLAQGFTHAGPQRADLRVVVDGKPAVDVLSRGQLKLVVSALKLAQGQQLREDGNQRCTYLIDDLAAELDRRHCQRVATILDEMGAQVFITCIEREDVSAIWTGDNSAEQAVFHVEHGDIAREGP